LLDLQTLKNRLHRPDLSRQEQALLLLATGTLNAKKTDSLRADAKKAGLTKAQGWNLSDILAKAKPYVIRTSDGWELTDAGQDEIRRLVPVSAGHNPKTNSSVELRRLELTIKSVEARSFVDEAIVCLEHGARRAAVVLSWVGAIAVLYEHVITNRLAEFNAEALRRNNKWRDARTADDLARLKEHDFLDVIEAISMIGKSAKKALQHSLDLRNGCGHPNSFTIGDAVVAAHIETLVLNVFARF
jgi:hypothetical protein